MPLLARLLGRRPPEPSPDPATCRSSFKFGKDQVRILLFRECERTDTKLLYDSSSVQKVQLNDPQKYLDKYNRRNEGGKNANTIPNVVEISHGVGFQCMPPSADVNIISEMIFGSVAMNFKGMSLKVHILNSPQRLMCTKVFNASSRNRCRTRTVSSNRDSANSNVLHFHNSNSKLGSNSNIEASHNYLSVNNSFNGQRVSGSPDAASPNIDDQASFNWSINKEDSGFYCDFSSQSSISSHTDYDSFTSTWDQDDGVDQPEDMYYFGQSQISESNMYNNIKWRFNRHLSTNLAYSSSPNSDSNCSPRPGSDSQFGSNSGTSTTESLSGNSTSSCGRRRGKLGLAILITLTEKTQSQMLQFLMEHALLLESALDRLRLSIQKAYYEPHSFISKMFNATEEVSLWFVDLLTGPRYKTPLWIELAGTQSNNQLSDQFLLDICYLLKIMDTKDTYFFMSTLITNVLMYHLGWVNYVSPFNTTFNSQQKELDSLNRIYPYNPLWAQLGELYGAIGTPARIARTLIYGRQKTSIPLIEKIINVLSYFIRCGKVKRCNIDPKTLSWDCVDLVMENYKATTNGTSDRITSDNDSPSSGDYIEMSTFSSNDTLIDSKDNDYFKTQHTNLGDFNLKLDVRKSTLKRTESCSSKLHSNLLINTNDLNSTTTLLPHSIDEEISIKLCDDSNEFIEKNVFNIPTKKMNGIHSEKNIFNENHVNTMKTSKTAQQLINCNFDYGKISDNIQNSTNGAIIHDDNKKTLNNGVVFVLGEDEALIGIKNKPSNLVKNDSDSILETLINEQNLHVANACFQTVSSNTSSQPKICCTHPCQCKHSKTKKHSGVKFEFDKYPQIVTNYMKSKNLELLDRHVIGKPGNLKIDGLDLERNTSLFIVQDDNDRCINCSNGQILQTPSNASELEFTSDIPPNRCDVQYAKEELITPDVVEPVCERIEPQPVVFVRKKLEKTLVVNLSLKTNTDSIVKRNSKVASRYNNKINKNIKTKHAEPIDLPISLISLNEDPTTEDTGYCNTMFGGVTDHYISDMILQGTVSTNHDWEHQMRRDLVLQSRTAPGGAVCLFADVDEWYVRVLGSGGNSCGMSALIASMLDALLQMQKAKVPSRNCLLFLETKLRELCLRSKTLAEILLNMDLCDMDYITKTLNLELNDVPLLLAIASTHTPQVALKYGISFR